MPQLQMLSPKRRTILKIFLLFALSVLLMSAATIPFIWESQSLWYKFGTDKTILRMGKIAGLFAAVLLFLQILLANKSLMLDKIFGLDKVYLYHHINGFIILALALFHVSFVLVPEGIENLPIGKKFWPEMVGAVQLTLLIVVSLSARFQQQLIPYHHWRSFHRPLGYLLFLGIAVHIIFVSDSFEKGVPRWSLITLICLILMSILLIKYTSFKQSKKYWKIINITQINTEIISLTAKPPSPFFYAPGQFAFLRFSGKNISSEPHPFTIASAPNRETIQFIIKKRGDWTSQLIRLATGTLSVQGPFGLFSYMAKPKVRKMIFIAAGIGITPMLSMLRQIGESKNKSLQPDVLLIWSVPRKNDLFLEKELEELKDRVPGLTIHYIYTRQDSGERLNRKSLERLLNTNKKACHIYICGPPAMMKETRQSLLLLGFHDKSIFWEKFSL